MDVVTEIATSQAVWAILCIILAAAVIREMRKENTEREQYIMRMYENEKEEAANRENRLMTHLERSNESQEQTAEALRSIRVTVDDIGNRMEHLEKKVYNQQKGMD